MANYRWSNVAALTAFGHDVAKVTNAVTGELIWQKVKKFTVTFKDTYDGSVLEEQEVIEGESVIPPPHNLIYPDGKTYFTRWDGNYTDVHQDEVVWARCGNEFEKDPFITYTNTSSTEDQDFDIDFLKGIYKITIAGGPGGNAFPYSDMGHLMGVGTGGRGREATLIAKLLNASSIECRLGRVGQNASYQQPNQGASFDISGSSGRSSRLFDEEHRMICGFGYGGRAWYGGSGSGSEQYKTGEDGEITWPSEYPDNVLVLSKSLGYTPLTQTIASGDTTELKSYLYAYKLKELPIPS